MNNKNYKGKLSEEALALNAYLSRYSICKSRKYALEKRREEILLDFSSPLKSPVLGQPRGGSTNNLGCASLSFKLDEIDTRIKEKIEDMQKELIKISEIIEFLPVESIERIILEYRYIDSFRWRKISTLENMARTTAIYAWKKGLYHLLEFAKVKQVIDQYSQSRKTG